MRYLELFIPYSMQKFGLSNLLQDTISFADRPEQSFTLQEVFDSLTESVDAYSNFVLEGAEVEDSRLHAMVNNSARLPDGSAMYGIFFHRLGAGPETFAAQDENYVGPEHSDVVVRDVHIHDLEISPVIAPSIGFNDGTIIQGPARDVIEFLDVIDQVALAGIQEAEYSGNPLSDAYFAMAHLSRTFYTSYVYDSDCGNFASNLTSAFKAEDEVHGCGGSFVTPTLTGRDITMLQKRIFGGIKMSQRFYEWGTVPGTILESLFVTEPDFTTRRQTKHNIICNHDALFHPNKGLVGLRIEFMENVLLDSIRMENLKNTGDLDHFLCSRKYRLSSTQELLVPQKNKPGRHLGPDIRGMAIGKCESVDIHNVDMDNLWSEEGAVFAFDVITDTTDRSDYESPAVSFDYRNIEIGELKGGAGSMVKPYQSQYVSHSFGSSTEVEGAVPVTHNEFDNAKLNIIFENSFLMSCSESEESAAQCLSTYNVGEDFMKDLNRQFQRFFRVTYGLNIDWDHSAPWWVMPTDPEGKWTILNNLQQGYVDFVCRKNDCSLPVGDGKVLERYLILQPVEEFVVYGTFGGTHGKTVYPEEFLLGGHYQMNGVTDRTLDIRYFGECPLSHTTMRYNGVGSAHRISYMTNCAVESDELGVGVSIGLMGGFCSNDAEPGFTLAGVAMMTFDDNPDLFVASEDYGASTTTPEQTVMWESVSNGVLGVTTGRAGLLTHAFTKAYHMPNEAATKYFRKWLDFTDEDT